MGDRVDEILREMMGVGPYNLGALRPFAERLAQLERERDELAERVNEVWRQGVWHEMSPDWRALTGKYCKGDGGGVVITNCTASDPLTQLTADVRRLEAGLAQYVRDADMNGNPYQIGPLAEIDADVQRRSLANPTRQQGED